MDLVNCRVAIASSGLGYIRRGIETWAEDSASELIRIGQPATLFQGGKASAELNERC